MQGTAIDLSGRNAHEHLLLRSDAADSIALSQRTVRLAVITARSMMPGAI